MKINCAHDELVELHKLQPNPKNPNKHPDKQVDMLAKIIDYQGQRSPIVVSSRSGFITKGHGRLMAIQKLGWEKAAVDFQDYESEAQEFADLIADNKIAELAQHDDLMMIESIKELDSIGKLDLSEFDFNLLGIADINFMTIKSEEILDEKHSKDSEKKYIIEVHFPNDMEMMDIHDDLSHRGYIVKIR